MAAGDAKRIVHHRDPTVGDVARADADHRNRQRFRDALASSTGSTSS